MGGRVDEGRTPSSEFRNEADANINHFAEAFRVSQPHQYTSGKFLPSAREILRVKELVKSLMKGAGRRHGKRWVSYRNSTHFCWVCVSLTWNIPWARFQTS